MRDRPAADSLNILVEIARRYDGQDHATSGAGHGRHGKEPALCDRLRRELGVPGIRGVVGGFARLAWRLHVPAAVPDLTVARDRQLSLEDRRLATDTLAFIDDPAASKAMLSLAEPASPLREPATWWLLNRLSNSWADHGLRPALKAAGIYDPDSITLREVIVPAPPANLPPLSVDEVARLTGDAARGKVTAARCQLCHSVGGAGADVGPVLDGWGRGKSADVIARAIVLPSAEIAQGYEGTEVKTKDGVTIQGVLIKEGDPLMMRSMGGINQIIRRSRGPRRRILGSLMMSAAQLGLTAQDGRRRRVPARELRNKREGMKGEGGKRLGKIFGKDLQKALPDLHAYTPSRFLWA